MRFSQGGIGYRDILSMPYSRYMAFIKAMNRMTDRSSQKKFFEGKEQLEEEWEKNKDNWLKGQPRPKG